MAQALYDVVIGALAEHTDPAAAIRSGGLGLDGDRCARGDLDPVARPEAASGPYQRFPAVVGEAPDQEHFRPAAAGAAAEQPGGEDPGTVEHDQISRREQLGQIAEDVMPERSVAPIQDQQAGGVALRERLLGDRRLGQLVVEFPDSQNSFFWGAWAGGTRPKCS
jgi:hypothetical protein